MRNFQILVYIPLILLAGCDNYNPTNLFKNPSFEKISKRNQATSWYSGQHAGRKAYKMAVDSSISFEGKNSFKIEQFTDQVYGVVEQPVILPKRINKRFVFSAMLKTKDVKPGDGWRLIINCRAKDGFIIKQYQSTPLTATTDWQKVTIEEDIPPETVKIDAGAILQSLGSAWIDQASFIIDPLTDK